MARGQHPNRKSEGGAAAKRLPGLPRVPGAQQVEQGDDPELVEQDAGDDAQAQAAEIETPEAEGVDLQPLPDVPAGSVANAAPEPPPADPADVDPADTPLQPLPGLPDESAIAPGLAPPELPTTQEAPAEPELTPPGDGEPASPELVLPSDPDLLPLNEAPSVEDDAAEHQLQPLPSPREILPGPDSPGPAADVTDLPADDDGSGAASIAAVLQEVRDLRQGMADLQQGMAQVLERLNGSNDDGKGGTWS